MNISGFFNTYPGMYIAQSFCHSIIAFIIVERAMNLWRISNPLIRQRFGLLVILLPIVSFPVYQLINPERGSISFRMESLFDMNRWLNLELWGAVPLGLFFMIIIIITTSIFLFQEMIPILKHSVESKRFGFDIEGSENNPVVSKAIEHLPVEKPDIFTFDDNEFILFSSTGKNPAVFISTGIVEALSMEQLGAVIAHEIAHIMRNKKPLLIIVFLFRVIMFFSPVVLLEFRRITQEEEKICDDVAVLLTKNPAALSEALKKLYHKDENINILQLRRFSSMKDSLEEHSHNMQIGSRIMRLEKASLGNTDAYWAEFLLTVFIIMGINYFVV
jgi:Zn-dependent protease with chaperone function